MNFLSIVLTVALNAVYVSCQGNAYNSTILFYKGPTLDDFVSYSLATAYNVADEPSFIQSRTTMIFFHGWQQSPRTVESQVFLNAYPTNGTFNILALDWSQAAADTDISNVVSKVRPIAYAVALHFVDKLNSQKKVPFSKMHLIGHSLGAHVTGRIGNCTIEWSGLTKYIGRITGLDPAAVDQDLLLSWHDAKFVDIIHTDAYGLGTNQNTGHVDFWPNNGTAIQPGCQLMFVGTIRCILMQPVIIRYPKIDIKNCIECTAFDSK